MASKQSTARVFLVDSSLIDEAQLDAFFLRLDVSEKQRCGRFVRSQRRRQFLTGRILLRRVIETLIGAPVVLQVTERIGLAPSVTITEQKTLGVAVSSNKSAVPFFSISHSGDWVACAVSAESALGLDIEVMDAGRDLAALARQAFDDAGCARLQASAPHERVPLFYRMWSEHEARFKLAHPIAAPAPSCIALPHPELSIVLCSALSLAPAPRIELITLA